jgi:two-component system OmpR family response regulator
MWAMSRPRVLLADDDPRVVSVVSRYLDLEGYEMSIATDGEAAVRIAEADHPDLIILDIMMPGEDGLSFCQRLRETLDIPILMVSARGLSIDRSIGLELGADDYLPKPFERRELVARVRAILRRGATATRTSRLRVGGVTVDLGQRAVLDGLGSPLPLTAGEFELLRCFLDRPGRVLSRDQLIEWTRGRSADAFDRNIDVQMSRLRKKLVESGFPEDGFKTVRNVGYVLTVAVENAS